MNFINLVKNELIKIFKRKITIVFIILIILSILLSAFLTNWYKDTASSLSQNFNLNKQTVDSKIKSISYRINTSTGEEQEVWKAELQMFNYLKESNYDDELLNVPFTRDKNTELTYQIKKLIYIDKEQNLTEYEKQKQKVYDYWDTFLNKSFEEWIEFLKEEYKAKYETEEITKEEYEKEYKNLQMKLDYGIGKISEKDDSWKEELFSDISNNSFALETKFDMINNKYVDKKYEKELLDNNLILEYRLKNGLPPQYNIFIFDVNPEDHMMCMFNTFVVSISMFMLGVFVIILSSITVAEEVSKGTIKSLLVVPCKRWKIIFSKILSIIIVIFILTILISILSALVGNIFFGKGEDTYLYVKDGIVKILSTNMQRTIRLFLEIPKILIYMLLGIALSTLTNSVVVSSTVTSSLYVVMLVILRRINGFIGLDVLKFLPSNNFDLASKILPVNNNLINFGTIDVVYEVTKTSTLFSIIVLVILAVLLVITIIDSFNKKQI